MLPSTAETLVTALQSTFSRCPSMRPSPSQAEGSQRTEERWQEAEDKYWPVQDQVSESDELPGSIRRDSRHLRPKGRRSCRLGQNITGRELSSRED